MLVLCRHRIVSMRTGQLPSVGTGRKTLMNLNEYYTRLFRYDHWANRECVAALRKSGSEDAKVLRVIGHVLSAQKLWLERLLSQPQSMAVWPAATLEECSTLVDAMAAAWRDYLSKLSIDSFGHTIEYRNSKGEPWSSRVEDVLIHVLMHSAYHRGQIAPEMRAAGLVPAYTDFIHAVRNSYIGEV